jgi:adenine/guanine phosphoribosyltransferase-like PRPP-binding protein
MNPHDFWQDVDPSDPTAGITSHAYPARFDDGRILRLPIRPLPDGQRALASLIINQASFAVVEALAADLAAKLAAFQPDVIVGLPTLGLTLAAAVAAKLGHGRYVPLGTSEKFWYRPELSVPLSSITTPDQTKRLFIDPRMLPLLTGRRVALVDDVISSGVSMAAGILVLQAAGVVPVALGTAMLQSDVWRARLADWQPHIASVLASPVLTRGPDGGWAE